MKFKLLVQLSHGITMLFGVAFGITISLLYQYQIQTQLTLLGLGPFDNNNSINRMFFKSLYTLLLV